MELTCFYQVVIPLKYVSLNLNLNILTELFNNFIQLRFETKFYLKISISVQLDNCKCTGNLHKLNVSYEIILIFFIFNLSHSTVLESSRPEVIVIKGHIRDKAVVTLKFQSGSTLVLTYIVYHHPGETKLFLCYSDSL